MMTMQKIAKIRYMLRVQGFVVVPRVFRRSLLIPLEKATRQLLAGWDSGLRDDPDYWSFTERDDPLPILYRIHRLEQKAGKTVMGILNAPCFHDVLDSVFGCSASPSACALIVKVPHRAAAVPWHRDPLPVPPICVYNFSVFLDEADSKNGCLEFVPGSHLVTEPERSKIFDPAWRPAEAVLVPASAGDVVIHDVCVLHGSGCNSGPKMRRSLITEFRPDWLENLSRSVAPNLESGSFRPKFQI